MLHLTATPMQRCRDLRDQQSQHEAPLSSDLQYVAILCMCKLNMKLNFTCIAVMFDIDEVRPSGNLPTGWRACVCLRACITATMAYFLEYLQKQLKAVRYREVQPVGCIL